MSGASGGIATVPQRCLSVGRRARRNSRRSQRFDRFLPDQFVVCLALTSATAGAACTSPTPLEAACTRSAACGRWRPRSASSCSGRTGTGCSPASSPTARRGPGVRTSIRAGLRGRPLDRRSRWRGPRRAFASVGSSPTSEGRPAPSLRIPARVACAAQRFRSVAFGRSGDRNSPSTRKVIEPTRIVAPMIMTTVSTIHLYPPRRARSGTFFELSRGHSTSDRRAPFRR